MAEYVSQFLILEPLRTYKIFALLPLQWPVNIRYFASVSHRHNALLFLMDSHNNLDPSLFRPYDPQTPQHDLHQEYQIPQDYTAFQRPPGADTGAPHHLPTQQYQPKHSLQEPLPRGYPQIEDHLGRMLAPFPIGHGSQSDESNDSLYVSNPSRSASLSPSLVHNIRSSAPGRSQPLMRIHILALKHTLRIEASTSFATHVVFFKQSVQGLPLHSLPGFISPNPVCASPTRWQQLFKGWSLLQRASPLLSALEAVFYHPYATGHRLSSAGLS